MLIHVTRYNAVQQAVHHQVEEHLRQLRQRLLRGIDHESILARLKDLWYQDFIPTTDAIRTQHPDLGILPSPTWEEVNHALPDILTDVQVKMINGTAKDALDYADHTGLKVIAIGGDKLARGLTLEGLSVSYFLRASRMYDTLMQMGRWFGYRPGYLDLCRLYTTNEFADWFAHITDAAEELREEFDLMAASGSTPRDYGLKVQSHSILLVTSRLKMRTAKNLLLSFSGQLLETVALYRNQDLLQKNLDAITNLIGRLPAPTIDPNDTRNATTSQWQGYLWENIPSVDVIDFLTAYRTHPDAYRVNSALLAEFITSMNAAGELKNWTIAFIGGGQGETCTISERPITMLQRTAESSQENRYSIGRLMSPRDEAIDLDEQRGTQRWSQPGTLGEPTRPASRRAKSRTSQAAPRSARSVGLAPTASGHGLTKDYSCCMRWTHKRPTRTSRQGTPPIIALGISFPGSNAGLKVEYKVNNVLWEQEYGASE